MIPFRTIMLNRPVPVYYGEGLRKEAAEIIRGLTMARRAHIVSDTNVGTLYGEEMRAALSAAGFTASLTLIPAGETNKNLNTVANLYNEFFDNGIGRKDLIIALGGGVVGDITGFAAATYMRGVPFVQIPTTLLAMTDSSIGGKTGVDLLFGKNLAGAFYQPLAILTDPSFLKTLPDEFMKDGMAEVIKYGLIKDKAIFDTVIQRKSKERLNELISRSIEIKSEIVEKDEKESGLRMILNYGHTLGHAIEKESNYSLPHGSAVAIGMVLAAKFGIALGITPKGTDQIIINSLEIEGLPTDTDIDTSRLIASVSGDKKREGKEINFVILKDIGIADAVKIPIEKLEEILCAIR